jgi:hypothetical protein
MWLPKFTFKTKRPARCNPPAEALRRDGDENSALYLIVITGDVAFYTRLEQIATNYKWQTRRAASLEEAEALLDARLSPIVVYDNDPHNDGWRTALSRLNALHARPCVLLGSRVADDYLWQEVVRNHGYDILCKFAGDEQLVRCLRMAWLWTRRRCNAISSPLELH